MLFKSIRNKRQNRRNEKLRQEFADGYASTIQCLRTGGANASLATHIATGINGTFLALSDRKNRSRSLGVVQAYDDFRAGRIQPFDTVGSDLFSS